MQRFRLAAAEQLQERRDASRLAELAQDLQHRHARRLRRLRVGRPARRPARGPPARPGGGKANQRQRRSCRPSTGVELIAPAPAAAWRRSAGRVRASPRSSAASSRPRSAAGAEASSRAQAVQPASLPSAAKRRISRRGSPRGSSGDFHASAVANSSSTWSRRVDGVSLDGPPEQQRNVRVVGRRGRCQEQRRTMGRPSCGRQPPGGAGELAAHRHVRLRRRQLGQPLRRAPATPCARRRGGGPSSGGCPRCGGRAASRRSASSKPPLTYSAQSASSASWLVLALARPASRSGNTTSGSRRSARMRRALRTYQSLGCEQGDQLRRSAACARSTRAARLRPLRLDPVDPAVAAVPVGVGVGVGGALVVPVGDVDGAVGPERHVAGREPGVVGQQQVAAVAGAERRAVRRRRRASRRRGRAGRRRCTCRGSAREASRPGRRCRRR